MKYHFIAGLVLAPLVLAAAEPLRVVQRDEKFSLAAAELKRGDTMLVTNDDPFLHHIYVESPQFNYDSGVQRPGRTLAITFDKPGAFVLQCAIHLKMKLRVSVQE